MKARWLYDWRDATGRRGPVTRRRVAYLLRAARSQGARIERCAPGYRIGALTLSRDRPAFARG